MYENDLANVRLGDTAEIKLNAYPDRMFKGRVSNICRFSIPIFARPRFGLKFRIRESCGWACS